MPKYKIPVTYSMWGLLDVEAKTFEDAVEFAASKDSPLPTNGDYIEDSAMVETESELIDWFNEGVLTEEDKEFIRLHWRNWIK